MTGPRPATDAVLSRAVEPSRAIASARGPVRYEVPLEAISEALSADGLHLSAASLHLPVPLSATAESPLLRIVSAELRRDDLLLHLACRAAAECMPFFATATMPDHAAAEAAIAALHSIAAPAPVAAAHSVLGSVPPPGIALGARITIEFADRQMRIQLPAIAMDTGRPGAEIRVASPDRKHTYRGIVVDATTVRGDLD